MASDRGLAVGDIPLDLAFGVRPIRFDRGRAPGWFWGTLAAHGALTAAFVLFGVLALAG